LIHPSVKGPLINYLPGREGCGRPIRIYDYTKKEWAQEQSRWGN
jgi:hypothetical protein